MDRIHRHLSVTKVAPEEVIGCERHAILYERRGEERRGREMERGRERERYIYRERERERERVDTIGKCWRLKAKAEVYLIISAHQCD